MVKTEELLKRVLLKCIDDKGFKEKFLMGVLKLVDKNNNLGKNGKFVRNIICG